jgi:acyl dehydratase
MIPVAQARTIDRNIHHLDAVMARARNAATSSMIRLTICGTEAAAAVSRGHKIVADSLVA